jgi:hypothetical protein
MEDNEELGGVRHATELERLLGRSDGYWQMSAQEQWDEDEANGLLDWDGSEEQALSIINENASIIDKQE